MTLLRLIPKYLPKFVKSMNCAAHGGSETKEDHFEVMHKLDAKIAQSFPHLKIKKSLVDMQNKEIHEAE